MPDNPERPWRIDEEESDLFSEPPLIKEESDVELGVPAKGVIVDDRHDASVTLDVALLGFEPTVVPLMQRGGVDRLADLGNVRDVVVVGPFSSGTNAMCEYLVKYFNVTVHPPREPNNATGWIGDMSEGYKVGERSYAVKWKHFPPLNSAEFPRVLPAGTLLIQMIREPLAWISSMVHHSYSLRSDVGIPKGKGKWHWLSQKVVLDSRENEFPNCQFRDAIDLWSCYAHGYLSGRFVAGDGYQFVTIVRHEDLVAYPVKVMQALESKGLRRMTVDDVPIPITPIEEYVGGYRGSFNKRDVAINAINRSRFIQPTEMRQWVTTQVQCRSTIAGLLGFIPFQYAMTMKRPMVQLYEPIEVPGHRPQGRVSLIPASGRQAPASGIPPPPPVYEESIPASGREAPASGAELIERLGQGEEGTDLDRPPDVIPWQITAVPPRLLPGLLTYADVVLKHSSRSEFQPSFTRPRPHPCVIHLDTHCNLCHMCFESNSWVLEQEFACRIAAIQFLGRDVADR